MARVLLITDGDHEQETSRAGGGKPVAGAVTLATALAGAGHDVEIRAWLDPEATRATVDLTVIGAVTLEVDRRDAFLGWVEGRAVRGPVWDPVEVLRWSSHRSYLLELEERGAPVVPTAWTARGDAIELGPLLSARGWERAELVPASRSLGSVDAGGGGEVVAAGREGQRQLDAMLARDDVAIQRVGQRRERAAVTVIGGQPLGTVQLADGGLIPEEPQGSEVVELARWVVEATGASIPVVRVVLQRDEVGTWELIGLDTLSPLRDLPLLPDALAGLVAAVTAGQGD